MSTELDIQNEKKKIPAMGILFLAVFIDLLGFGIIIPILPLWTTENLGYNSIVYGILVASYSFAQF